MKDGKFRGNQNSFFNDHRSELVTEEEKHNVVLQWELQLMKTPNDPELLFNLGVAYMDLELFENAIDRLECFLAIKPNNIDAMLILATSNFSLRDFEAAIQWNQRVLELDPNDVMAKWNLGTSLFANFCFEDGIRQLEAITNQYPSDQNTWVVLGHWYAYLGRFRESIEFFNTARKINRISDLGLESHAFEVKHTKARRILSKLTKNQDTLVFELHKAIQLLEEKSVVELKEIILVVGGFWWLNPVFEDPEQKYVLESISSDLTINLILCLHYVALKKLGLAKYFDFDLSSEYELALLRPKMK